MQSPNSTCFLSIHFRNSEFLQPNQIQLWGAQRWSYVIPVLYKEELMLQVSVVQFAQVSVCKQSGFRLDQTHRAVGLIEELKRRVVPNKSYFSCSSWFFL